MITYVYETIPKKVGEKARHFEMKQAMNEAPLTKHPKTGEPVRRVILGGYGIIRKVTGGKVGLACGCYKGGCCG